MPVPKRIVVTGVSRGLGRALVEGFIARGHVVFGCARSAGAIAELGRCYPPPNGFAVVDVTRDADVQAWAAGILRGGPPDLLVNNAATIHRNAPLWKVPAEEFSRVVDVNVKGTVKAGVVLSEGAPQAAKNSACPSVAAPSLRQRAAQPIPDYSPPCRVGRANRHAWWGSVAAGRFASPTSTSRDLDPPYMNNPAYPGRAACQALARFAAS
jgi:NAD(P)-dependent dehydrogenase (short-subunit alcohol dehydrogenase family)